METPKFCIDCRHFRPFENGTTDEAKIKHGECLKQEITSWDLVTGEKKAEYWTAAAQRSTQAGASDSCGQNGQWWEPKDDFTIDKTISDLRGQS